MTDQLRHWLFLLSAILVGVVGLGAEWLAQGTRLGFAEQRDLLTGWAIAGCGLVAWALVPRSRVGILLLVVGLTWFIGTTGDPLTEPGRLARALTFLYAGVLAHALFTWPTGRVERALERVLVAGGYGVALLPPLWTRDTGLWLIAAMLAGALLTQQVSLARRERRGRRPVLALGLGLAVILASKGALAFALHDNGVAYPGDPEAIWQIALVVVAAGLASSLISLERRRRSVTDLVVRLGDEGPVTSAAVLAEATGLSDEGGIRDALIRAEEMSARNMALRDELSAQVVAIEASRRRLLEAGDEERESLEKRLRQGAASRLARLEVHLIEERASLEPLVPDAIARLDRAFEQLRRAQLELDELARGLDPGLLRERGLDGALRDLAERSPVPVTLWLEGAVAQVPGVERTLYYVASEALANVAKHAQAARAWLRVSVKVGEVTLVVEDDGVGVDGAPSGSGLRGLRDRLDALGGSLVIGARAGGGTSLRASLPLGVARVGGVDG